MKDQKYDFTVTLIWMTWFKVRSLCMYTFNGQLQYVNNAIFTMLWGEYM